MIVPVVRQPLWTLEPHHVYDGKLPLQYTVVLFPSEAYKPEEYCYDRGWRFFHKKLSEMTAEDADQFVQRIRIEGEETAIYKDYEFKDRQLEGDFDALASFMSAVNWMCRNPKAKIPEYIEILYKVKI